MTGSLNGASQASRLRFVVRAAFGFDVDERLPDVVPWTGFVRRPKPGNPDHGPDSERSMRLISLAMLFIAFPSAAR